jgi:hypothetical protein
VIYVVKDGQGETKVTDAFSQVKSNFVSKIERGITFNFMRLDASREPEFAALFTDGDVSQLPIVVVMNPGKRKRFLKHEGALTATDIS